jgi:hypothetical protein
LKNFNLLLFHLLLISNLSLRSFYFLIATFTNRMSLPADLNLVTREEDFLRIGSVDAGVI